MKLAHHRIHGDLKATLERSLDLKAVLEHMTADQHPVSYAEAMSRIGKMQKQVRTTKATLGFYESKKTGYSPNESPRSRRSTPNSSPMNRRHQGKKKLFTTLKDSNLRILASRAGKRLKDQSDTQALSPGALTKGDYSYDKSDYLTMHYSEDCDPPLPITNMVEALEAAIDNSSSKATGVRFDYDKAASKTLKTIERTRRNIEGFKNKIEMYYEYSKIPKITFRRRSTAVGRRTLQPGSLSTVVQQYGGTPIQIKQAYTPDIPIQRESVAVRPTITPDVISHKTEVEVKRKARSYTISQGSKPKDVIETQEEKLSLMIDRLIQDRPQTLRSKLRSMLTSSPNGKAPLQKASPLSDSV